MGRYTRRAASEEALHFSWMNALAFAIVFACVALCVTAQSRVVDPCAPGVPRPPDIWCPDTVLGGNVVQSTGGIVAASSYSSCSAVEDAKGRTLDCGDSPETSQMTVLDVSLTPGSGQTVQYRALIIRTPPAAGASSTAFPGTQNQCKDISGQCSTTQEVIIEIQVSDSVVVYQLQPTNLEIPFATAAFHTNAFGKKIKDHEERCGSFNSDGGTATYKQEKTRSQFGPEFDRYSGGVEGFNNIIAPPVIPNFNVPESFVITNKNDELAGSNCIEPLSVNDNALTHGITSCNPAWSGYLCSATNPSFDSAVNYGMQPNQKPDTNGILLLPPSPFSRQNPLDPSNTIINANLRPFTDLFTYESPYEGLTTSQYEALAKNQWRSCLRKYSPSLTHQHPSRVWAGTYFYIGSVPNYLSYYRWRTLAIFETGAVDLNLPNTRFLSDVRPVCIGCGWGPFFPSNNVLQPVPAKNEGKWSTGDPWPYPNDERRPGELITCSADDDDCLGTASSLFSSNRFRQAQPSTTTDNAAGPSVPIAVCNAVDYITLDKENYCHIDRIGAYETLQDALPNSLRLAFSVFHGLGNAVYAVQNLVGWFTDSFNIHIKDQYNTADTFGTIGEPCQVLQIKPQALPQYAVEVRMYTADGTKTLLDSVRLSNMNDLGQLWSAENIDPSDDTKQNPNTAGQSVVIGAERLLFAELTGYETVNGKIAPDLYGNIVVCNLTKQQQGLYQSDTDSQFGTPRNPWVYSNNEECGNFNDEYKRCEIMDPLMCASSGKVPLPQCLAARPRVPGESFNPYAWWYYQNPSRASRTNEGFGSSAMPSSRFAEPEVQDLICASPRYAGVPGWKQGFDWTLEDRLRDQLNTTQDVTSITGQHYLGPNAQERALRDELQSHTACHVVGYFNDWQRETSCQNFLTQAAYQRYLPPNFVTPLGGAGTSAADGKCSLPNYAVDGDRLLYFGNTQSNTQSSVRFRVGITGTLVRVENSVSSGTFETPTTCSVMRGGVGKAQMQVRNTGTLNGRYLITSRCTNGIRQVGERIVELQPSKLSSLVQVNMAHDGSATAGSVGICTFNLTHPDYRTQMIFAQLEKVECVLRLISSNNPDSGAGAWQQNVNFSKLCAPDINNTVNSLCKPADFIQPALETNGIAAGIIYYIAAMLTVFLLVLFCVMNCAPLISKAGG